VVSSSLDHLESIIQFLNFYTLYLALRSQVFSCISRVVRRGRSPGEHGAADAQDHSARGGHLSDSS